MKWISTLYKSAKNLCQILDIRRKYGILIIVLALNVKEC